ncbi:MAG: alpha/beta fold hydrolase [Acidimicrobiales bacterium]
MTSPTWVSTDDGCKLAAYDFGGAGEPLLFAHATGFHAHLWLPVIERVRHRFHCFGFDQRGHGASPTPPNGVFDWRRMGEDARRVATELGLGRPKAVGHSGGGAHLVFAEQDHPRTWDALWTFEAVLPDAALAIGTGENPMAAGALRRRDHFASRRAASTNFATKPPFSTFTPEALQLYVDHGFVDAPDGGVTLACRREDEAAMYSNAFTADAFERLADVQIEIHLVCGGDTTHFPEARLVSVVAQLPHATLEVIEGVGHFGPFEAPDRVASSILAAFG